MEEPEWCDGCGRKYHGKTDTDRAREGTLPFDPEEDAELMLDPMDQATPWTK